MKIALEGTQLIRHPCIQIYVEIFRLFQRTDRQNRDPRGRQTGLYQIIFFEFRRLPSANGQKAIDGDGLMVRLNCLMLLQ